MVPSYVVTDNLGNVIYGAVTIVNSNTITIDFNPASTGRVYIIT